MNQSAFLNQLESSKLNQKYHIAIQSNAVPIMPGQRRNRTTKAAAGLDSKDLVPADPKAMRLAMMTPTREKRCYGAGQVRTVRGRRNDPIAADWQIQHLSLYQQCSA